MIDESDKSLFRSTVNRQMPIDKDGDKEEAYNNKKHWNKPFEDYSYLPKPNLSASDSISHSQAGVSPKTLKKMKKEKDIAMWLVRIIHQRDINFNFKIKTHFGRILYNSSFRTHIFFLRFVILGKIFVSIFPQFE